MLGDASQAQADRSRGRPSGSWTAGSQRPQAGWGGPGLRWEGEEGLGRMAGACAAVPLCFKPPGPVLTVVRMESITYCTPDRDFCKGK